MNTLRMTGVGGTVKVGYQVAARLQSWELAGDQILARGAQIDPFWITAEGVKTLSLPMGRTEWRWDHVDILGVTPTLAVKVHGSPTVRR